MTAESFAELVQARRSGAGRWMAKCPAHEDSSPSLSIKAGRDGRVLLHCWAGCPLTAILKTLGLTMRDLFDGRPATPQQRALLAQERAGKAARHQRERMGYREAIDLVRGLENIRDEIGGKLARSPEDDKLGALFHLVCRKVQAAEVAAESKRPVTSGPLQKARVN